MHPIQQLAQAIPASADVTHVTHGPRIPAARLHETVTNSGIGLDHAYGEQPLAHLRYEFPSRGESMGSMASLIVSDRRLLGRLKATNIPDWTFDVPYAAVTGTKFESGMLNTKLHVDLNGRRVTLPIWGSVLRDLFLGVQKLPPAERWIPSPPIAPGDGDPTGAHALFARAVSGDARIGVLLRVVHEASRVGQITDGPWRVQQIDLLDRQLRAARGMNQGWWLSTLSPPVVASLLCGLMGDPAQRWDEPGGGFGFDFPLSARSGSTFATNVVGLALLATVGVGWYVHPRGPAPRVLRVQITPRPCGSGLSLQASAGGPLGSLSSFSPELMRSISDALSRLEARALLTEMMFGVAESAEQLLSVPREALEQRVGGLLGPGSLAAFFPR